MSDKADNTRRIAKNTIYLYARSLFSLFVSLYSSRLILNALGVNDYGIYNVVGGFVSMFWLVSGSLSSAISRFLNYEMGQKNQERLKMVFSMSLNIMLFLALIVLLLTESFGLWYLNHKMNIPLGREEAAFWVFQFSVVTVMSGFMVVPFNACILAHERMGIYAYLGIAEAIMRLVIALILAFGKIAYDKLILYAFLWLIATLLMQATAAVYCRRQFIECRLRRLFDKHLFKEMFAFAGWNFIGSISGTFSGQGVNVVLNSFFGTTVNAARGLADTVSRSVTIFVNNFTVALNPQITQSHAAGENDYMMSLVLRGTKFSFYILFILALPLILETRFVLYLWLGQVPDYSVNFVRLILLLNLLEIHGVYFGMAQRATGKIKKLQLITSIFIFLIFPLSFIGLKYGLKPEITYIINILISGINLIITLNIACNSFHSSIIEIYHSVYKTMWRVAILASIIPIGLHFFFPYGWTRFILCTIICLLTSATTIWYLGCTVSERALILRVIQSKLPFLARHN